MAGPFPLAIQSWIINTAGASGPPFEDVLASKIAEIKAIYGQDLYLAPDSMDMQKLAVEAQAQYDTNQAGIAGYLAYSPISSQGVGLSSVVKINGIRRLSPSNSSADLRLVGQTGSQIISGVVEDGFGNQWALPSVLVIPPSGELVATAICQVPGAITAAANTINQIVNVQLGWQSATNLLSATVGNPVETDAALRRRQAIATALAAVSPLESIAAVVANVAGVQRSRIYQNDTDAPDANGVPGHSIAAVVEGGDVIAIAQAIASKKSPGCGTFGTVTEVVIDEKGVPNTIDFFHLTKIQIFVTVTIKPFLGYVETTGNLIVSAILAAVNGLGIGTEVYLARIWGPAGLSGDAATISSGLSQSVLDGLASTFVVKAITIGIMPTPTNSVDIVIPFYAAAMCAAANVTLVLQP